MYKLYKVERKEDPRGPDLLIVCPMQAVSNSDGGFESCFEVLKIWDDSSLSSDSYIDDKLIEVLVEYDLVFFGSLEECRGLARKLVTTSCDCDCCHEKDGEQPIKSVFRFIEDATPQQLYDIVLEIHTVHDKLMVFDEDARSLINVESVSMNGSFIQLNLEKD